MNQHSHARSEQGGRGGHHDWHSAEYVGEWIGNDVTRDDERRPIIQEMLAHAPFSKDAAVEVLDVGGGYGVLTEEVFNAFPNARVTLQDYSSPMLEQARERLARFGGRVSYAQRDFSKRGWTEGLGGPFDMAISGIAIHNLGDEELMKQVYESIQAVLKPGGVFLDLDYVFRAGVDNHLAWLRAAGFAQAQCPRLDGSLAMLVASRV